MTAAALHWTPQRTPHRTPQRHDRPDRALRRFCAATARAAVRSLYDELSLYPKPGLVSLVDSGSHADMDAGTFLKSLFALRHYYARITAAGCAGLPFSELKRLGVEAEARMLAATGGINTHRGAIFCLGLVCAAAGDCRRRGIAIDARSLRAALLERWGDELAAHVGAPGTSHGQRMAALHAAGGAREEGALGLPSVFGLALPALRRTLADGRGWRQARIDALFALMAGVADTNVYYRGGAGGAALVRGLSRRFVARGGTAHPAWLAAALRCHRLFCRKRISPGGAADLLAAACLVQRLCALEAAGEAA
jgi:triphosphoribosyl-dephospho-CoA synthase